MITYNELKKLNPYTDMLLWFENEFNQRKCSLKRLKSELLIKENYSWIFWSMSAIDGFINKFTPEELDYAIKKQPYSALIFISNLLSDEQLRYCAKLHPDIALESSTEYLSAELLKEIVHGAFKDKIEELMGTILNNDLIDILYDLIDDLKATEAKQKEKEDAQIQEALSR